MRLIEENPFRVLGLPVDASEKEIVKRFSDLEILAEMGKEKKYDSDLNFIAPINRTPGLIREARQKIEQPQNRFYQSLWWFWPNNPVDELAIDVLQDGDSQKALNLWQAAIQGASPNRNNISNFKNLGLLALWLSVKEEFINEHTFKTGAIFTGQFISSKEFNFYQSSILEGFSNYELGQSSADFINDLYAAFVTFHGNNNAIAQKRFLSYVSKFPVNATKNIKSALTSRPLRNIDRAISKSKDRRDLDPSHAANVGFHLKNAVRDEVKILEDILSQDNLEYQIVCDKVAEELLECAISYFNFHLRVNTGTDPGDKAYQCLRIAKDFAIGAIIKNRIKENSATIESWIANEDERKKVKKVEKYNNYIIDNLERVSQMVFPTVNDAKKLVERCRPKLRELKEKLGSNASLYKDASNAVVHVALNTVIEVLNRGQSMGLFEPENIKNAHLTLRGMKNMYMTIETKRRYQENKNVIEEVYYRIRTHESEHATGSNAQKPREHYGNSSNSWLDKIEATLNRWTR